MKKLSFAAALILTALVLTPAAFADIPNLPRPVEKSSSILPVVIIVVVIAAVVLLIKILSSKRKK